MFEYYVPLWKRELSNLGIFHILEPLWCKFCPPPPKLYSDSHAVASTTRMSLHKWPEIKIQTIQCSILYNYVMFKDVYYTHISLVRVCNFCMRGICSSPSCLEKSYIVTNNILHLWSSLAKYATCCYAVSW